MVGRVAQHGVRMQIIAHVGPESALVALLAMRVANVDRRVVGVQGTGSQDFFEQHVHQRGEPALGHVQRPAVGRLT